MDLGTATATELAEAIRLRRLSSRELLDDLLKRADERNPALNAIVAWDTDRARAAAKAADDATLRGEFAGPLHGLPMTVKDVFETEGLVTTAGARELAGYVPGSDAVAVARLKAAGAIVFGKTNTPLYAGDWQTYNDVYGRTNNPWDLSRTAGGSSGGSAAAVAAGLTPLELGSDIGGSIRVPAHFTGVFGLKPSWGIVPLRGHIPGPPGTLTQPDIGVAGPIARTVADLRLSLGIVAGPLAQEAAGWRLALDPGPEMGDAAGLRVATAFGEGGDVTPIAADVRAVLDDFASRLVGSGARVVPAPLPVPLHEGLRTWQRLVLPIIAADLPEDVFTRLAGQEDPDAQVMSSRFRSWLHAAEEREHQRGAWAGFFEQHDVLVAPVMPTAAYPHDTGRPLAERVVDVDGTAVPHRLAAAWCCAIGSALLPVVALPAGVTPSGLPVGVQLVGPFLSDLRLLRIAEVIADATDVRFTAP